MRFPTAMTMDPRTQPTPDWDLVSRGLRRFALGLTGRADLAEDLAQQTIAHLLARNPEKAAHLGYARSTMTRLWLDEQRSLGRRVKRYAMAARLAISRQADREGRTDSELASSLHERIAALPPAQRAALVLRLVEGLGYEQIGEALGSSTQAVRANLHLARRSIARSMGELP